MAIHQFICGLFFVFAGVMHFVKSKFFLALMPPYIPFHKELVLISGAAEFVFGGSLIYPPTQVSGAMGLILLLIAVFPANIYMATSIKFQKISPWIRWGRLPLQGVLIWWVSLYL